jgi:hypothetical protein
MIGFLTQDVRMNEMVETKNRYIPLNVGQVGHFRTPKIHGNPSDHEVHSMGPDILCTFLKLLTMSARGVYLILFTIANRHLSSGVATERNSAMGKNMNDIHLCKNLRLGLWISLNLSLVDFLEIASLNSTLLKFLIALDSGKQDLEKSKSSLKWDKS